MHQEDKSEIRGWRYQKIGGSDAVGFTFRNDSSRLKRIFEGDVCMCLIGLWLSLGFR